MNIEPILFSDYFKIDKQLLRSLGIFDPILNFDTKLFVEPLLLKSSESAIMQEAFHNYNKFFANLMLLLKNSQAIDDKCWKAAKNLVHFPEYKYTCIGYGSNSIHGSGSGAELNDKILKSAKEIVDFAQDSSDIFLLLPLLEEGIGADIISDMTQNIIDEDICKYTVECMMKIGIEGNTSYHSKNLNEYLLPYNPYSKCSIKLLPVDILSNLPLAETFDEWIVKQAEINNRLRFQVNKNVGHTWFEANKSLKKQTLLDQLKTDKSFFLEILKILKEESFEHYDIEEDYEGLHRWLEDSKKFIKPEIAINISKVAEYSNLLLEVEKIISLYKEHIEKHDMWRMFWTKNYSKFNHVKEFYSQMLFYMVCHTWLASQSSNIVINREFNKKSKILDFKFSISDSLFVIIQLKHSNNYAGLEKSYLKQIEIYNEESVKSFYIVMDFEEKTPIQLKTIKRIERPYCKIITIDVTKKDKYKNTGFGLFEYNFEDLFVEYEGLDFNDSLYIQEKRNGGANSYQKYKPLKDQVEELCKDMAKHSTSALNLCTKVAQIIEKDYEELLQDFGPYRQFQRENTDWTNPTFYNWCNKFYKLYK